MPTDRSGPAEPEQPPAQHPGAADEEPRTARRVLIEPGGPVLVEGPVEVQLPDGGTARSDRFLVALCTCRRSRTYPWCDTSHRRRARPPGGASGGGERAPQG